MALVRGLAVPICAAPGAAAWPRRGCTAPQILTLCCPLLPPSYSLCSSRDADRAWEKMDGMRVDGARWKVDWANRKVGSVQV